MQQTLVSILIPFKNASEYFNECLNSIQNQTYANFEVIAIDDNSTDKSFEIISELKKKDPRFKAHKSNGKGIIDALKTAFKISEGKFITRMDADDIMTPDKIEQMVAGLITSGKGHVAIGKVSYFSARGISNGYERYEAWLNQLTETGSNYSEIYKECVIPSPCWMTFREDLEACSAFEPDRYPEDYDLCFRFYEKGLKCIPCNNVLHHWRDYATRTSRTCEHYAQNYFLQIKLHYFLKLDYSPKRPLVVWGAGTKGKEVAKRLIKKDIKFKWLCDNPNKIGKDIYGKILLPYAVLEQLKKPLSIITVANPTEQSKIHEFFLKLEQQHGVDYFFFC